jgi:glycosyltransferase involved in cell wall biosynthesis
LRLVIDMQGAQTESRFRGIGRYTTSFIKALIRQCSDHEIVLALNGTLDQSITDIRREFENLLPIENIRVWFAPPGFAEINEGSQTRREIAETVRESFLASLSPDIVLITSLFEGFIDDAAVSIGRVEVAYPTVAMIYDLIPLVNEKEYLEPNPKYSKYYKNKIETLCKANLFLAISEFSRTEAIEKLPLKSYQVVNISSAIDESFGNPRSIQVSQQSVLTHHNIDKTFILYVGGADERKNLPRLLEAYSFLGSDLRAAHLLVIAGKISSGQIALLKENAALLGISETELRFTDYVSEEELVCLYSSCEIFVFPSWHEGFGLPALEAMACGAPVLAANTSSLPEVVRFPEALFDPFSSSDISAKMTRGLKDEDFRKRAREHGKDQCRKFSWELSAKQARDAMTSLVITHAKNNSAREIQIDGRPKLAFVSPIYPSRSGIANYSAMLLPALKTYYDITIIVDRSETDALSYEEFEVQDSKWLLAHCENIERVVYQMGNSPFHIYMLELMEAIPGTVVLHDFFLSGLYGYLELSGVNRNAWNNAIYQSHGYSALAEKLFDPDIETAKMRLPVNSEVFLKANNLILHSEYSRYLAKLWYGSSTAATSHVIPHLRHESKDVRSENDRRQLGINENALVVCSFGFLDPTKLNHMVLEAWLSSSLRQNPNALLVFVGENHGGDYGKDLLESIQNAGLENQIRITGWVSKEDYQIYLRCTDIAVQLRAHSRGESSGSILECLAQGVATITNANGSFAELNHDSVRMLPDAVEVGELVLALDELSSNREVRQTLEVRAREVIATQHSPTNVARSYFEAIEAGQQLGNSAVLTLVKRLAAIDSGREDAKRLADTVKMIAINHPTPTLLKTIFIDVTATVHSKHTTGVERVARSITSELLRSPPEGYRVEPVYLVDAGDCWCFRLATGFAFNVLGCAQDAMSGETVAEIKTGDLILGLDISGDPLVRAASQGYFKRLRDRGVLAYYFVHDLLPMTLDWAFPPGTAKAHEAWLRAVCSFDGAICNSATTADQLRKWYAKEFDANPKPFKISSSLLGCDIGDPATPREASEEESAIQALLAKRKTFLMVGTIEPRKGYLDTIKAFSLLWDQGLDANLVIVGKEGWIGLDIEQRRTIPETMAAITRHPELGKRLHWLDSVNDSQLDTIYQRADCLIAASIDEGFGLPLFEAARYDLPILARDIPVFREIAEGHASFFNAATPKEISRAVMNWLNDYEMGTHKQSTQMKPSTWHDCTLGVLAGMMIGNVVSQPNQPFLKA